jgi:glycosyltransferase involved in cell wall biosynthesis
MDRAGLECRLHIVGDGPERHNLERLAEKKGLLNQKVFFFGWCERSALFEHYRQAHVFALASDYEGMPNVILEAMASSLAIVATRAPGTDELVSSENGFLIERDRLEDFDAAFARLHRDRALLGSLQQASHRKAEGYTWNATADSYLHLCHEFIQP